MITVPTDQGVVMRVADRTLTPGTWDPTLTRTQILTKGFTKGRRPGLWESLKMKAQVMALYGIPLTPLNWHKYTMDHLIPIELGGNGFDILNVWPQPRAEAKIKDRDENWKFSDVKHGFITLPAAQAFFQTRWSR